MSITVDLLRVCRDITLDGEISGHEVWELAQWMNDHPEASKRWPGEQIAHVLQSVFHDGEIDEAELHHVAKLLSDVEREAARRIERIVPEPDDETVVETPPIRARGVRPMADPLCILPRYDRVDQVLSSDQSQYYSVDLSTHTCTCPDWCRGRHRFPNGHVGRMCKHIAERIHAPTEEDQDGHPLAAFLAYYCCLRSRGLPPNSQYTLIELPSGPALICHGTREWIDVFALKNGEYDRFGFNLVERRWAYGESPKGASIVRKAVAGFRFIENDEDE